MRYLVELLIFFGLAAAIGLGLTGMAVSGRMEFGALTAGAWTAHPGIGSPNPDPYSRAAVARRGQVPIALGDGLAFIVEVDDEGEQLRLGCEYRVEGGTLPARFWTLALLTVTGQPHGNTLGRQVFTSSELLRRESGGFDIAIAPNARPGNWLPNDGIGPFRIALRLYDTPLTTRPERAGETAFPRVQRVHCP